MNQKVLIGVIASIVAIVIIIAISLSGKSNDINDNGAKTPTVADGQRNGGDPLQQFDILEREKDFDITKIPENSVKNQKDFKPAEKIFPEDLSLRDENMLDPSTVARLLEEYGTYANLYAELTDQQRRDLIDHLNLKNELRDNIGDILAIENNTDNRAFMLFRVLPDSTYGADDDNLFDTVDRELIGILDRATESEIGSTEWVARMHLSQLTDQEYALTWVRDASVAHPEDAQVNFVASTLTMKIGASIEGVSISERSNAEEYLQDMLLSEESSTISPSDRTSAYYGLYWSDDKEGTVEFFRERLEMESDPSARSTLEGLIQRIENKFLD